MREFIYIFIIYLFLAKAAHLPVMVYIHGGRFMEGSGNDDFQGPDFLIEHDVIVVRQF